MEHGDPFNNGWFAFGSDTGGGGIDPNGTDLPPGTTGSFSLQTGWGGAPGFYGGFGRTNPTDLTGVDHFNFWINPDGGEYTLEINLQEDDNSDGAINPPDDDEFQFNCVIGATGPCAVAGGGWQLVSIPLADFVDDGSFLFGGNGVLDAGPDNGELINVVIAVIGDGTAVNFRTDDWVFREGPLTQQASILIDDFESGVAPGVSCPTGGLPLGFCTFNDPNSTVSIATTETPPAPLPGAATPNQVLQMDADVVSFAGFIHGFTNAATDTWVPQDWSTSEGISFWMYGTGSGTTVFVDVLDNRNPGSTKDDAERWSVDFVDDFTGWQQLEFPFSEFARKEVGNGAPNDGFGLFEVHGYAIGTVTTPAPLTVFVDEVSLYGVGTPPPVAVQFAQQTFVTEGTTGQVVVKLTRPLGPDDPDQLSIDYATERSNAVPGEEFTPTSGTLTFVKGGPSELSFEVETFDDTKFEGDEQIVIRLTNPVDIERGTLFQGSVLIDDDDPFDPKLLDDFEQGAYLWDAQGDATIDAMRVETGSPDARPGQDAVEHVGVVDVPVAIDVAFRSAGCPKGNAVLPVHILSPPVFDATAIDHTTVRLGVAGETRVDRRTGEARRQVADVNGDGLDDLVFLFRFRETGLSCDRSSWSVTGETFDGQPISNVGGFDASLTRDFPLAQDWSDTERLDFWYHGAGGGEEITVTLQDNRAPDPGPAGWTLAWADEFDDPAGTTPNPANWAYEIGDTTPDGKNGWGNEELQYYTDDAANAATDGAGNLVIALTEADGSQECYYGPCEFESARLLTQNRAEFAYGRIESRLLVPDGGSGLWPAFWSLGTDITYNPWPGAGEIDIMEYVSRLPNEIFGTVHGPGYSGGASIGGIEDFGVPVYEAGDDGGFHTFTVEWEPNLITWYVDGEQYHQVTPADVPGPWVFDKPFFLLLNFAIGGNFGGNVDPANTYPQEYLVDYVRVYQGPDTAERFEASFVDDTLGWRRVSIPVTDFERSADQPAGAPDDGLTLTDVWGYGFEFPNGTASGEARFDLVERVPVPPPTELVVTTLADGGEGSLREALGLIADGGTITFDPTLAGGSMALTAGPLVVGRSVTVDGSTAPGITLDGGGVDRVLVVAAGAAGTVSDLTLRNGYGFQLAGCVLNNGTLTLDHATVTGCTMTTDKGDFWQGGGGIYNGDGATFNLIDSTVSDNTSGWTGGGIYSFFNTTTNVVRSTISGNVALDVAGGLRTLGTVNVDNSSISGNTSTAWHGGAMFVTDGVATITNSTVTGNNAPAGTTGGLFVGTFGPSSASLDIENSIVAANGDYGCFLAPFGAGAVALTSLGGNVFTDGTCFPVAGDQQVADAGLGALADNGGPTFTHALLAGSPAIDAAVGSCPDVDQRGVSRPQGGGCDVGAFELESAAP